LKETMNILFIFSLPSGKPSSYHE